MACLSCSLDSLGWEADGEDVVVTARDGRTWRLRVTRRATGDELPESCGKDAKPVQLWDVATVAAG